MTDEFPDRGAAIEGLLPRDFTYALGLYLQTCAQSSCLQALSLSASEG